MLSVWCSNMYSVLSLLSQCVVDCCFKKNVRNLSTLILSSWIVFEVTFVPGQNQRRKQQIIPARAPITPPMAADPKVISAAEVDCKIAATPPALRAAWRVPTPATTVPNWDMAAGTNAAAPNPAKGPAQIPAAVSEITFTGVDGIASVLLG